MRRVDLSVVGAFFFAFLFLGITLVVVVAGGVVVGTPLLASSSSGLTLQLFVLGAKPPILTVFVASVALSVVKVLHTHCYSAPSDPGVVVTPGEVVHVHVLHGGLHLLQSEHPVAVVCVPDVVIIVGEALENNVLKRLSELFSCMACRRFQRSSIL